jgi:rod shape determining protein RodA
MIQHLKKFDWILISSSLILVVIGLVLIYSISLSKGDFLDFKKQIIFFGISFILMIILSFFDWRAIKENSYFILILYSLCILLLLGLFFFAPEIRGVRSWYKIGNISFDPIGISTIVLIILLAKYFSMRHIEMYRLPHILLSGFYVLIPFLLIARQPDLGSALILVALWIGILIISGIKLRHFLILIMCGILVLSLSWVFFLKQYQKDRIVSFLAPQVEPLGINWSQSQSRIAIGSGGVFGKGLGQGSQTQNGFLSEPHTDFIFSAIAEEFGLIGVAVVLSLFIILIWRIMKIAISAGSNFPRLFAFGFAIVLFSQMFIHVGMNLGILPVIGLPLPLVSYGGSSLIIIFIGLGLIQSFRTH